MNNNVAEQGQRARQLMIEPFVFVNLEGWESQLVFNDHGTLQITGLIAEENRNLYAKMATSEVKVCAKALDEAGEEIILFRGVLTQLAIASQFQFHTMTITVKTESYLLDQTLHTRTFQPSETTYQSMIQTCLDDAGGAFVMREKQDEKAQQLTVQYQETDWEFILRMARRLGVVVLPEIKTEGKRVLIGLVKGTPSKAIQTPRHTMAQSKHNPNSLIHYELGVYTFETRDIYPLGQLIRFAGRTLVINEINSRLVGSELVHVYTACVLKENYEVPYLFQELQGVALRGEVLKIVRDQVQVKIHEDENQANSGVRWFDYATVYSSPDGTGWFVMPEIGDEIRLLFPNATEIGAYVASSVHIETNGGRINPDHKSWKTKYLKEILFTPERILITNNNGLSVDLVDGTGIRINSDKKISMRAKGAIDIVSQSGNVNIHGSRSVDVQQGAAQIQMKEAIEITGGKINMN